ncbi:hypothetical protein PsAD13_02687 [Pseudovibrio sp. Ad13]|uniref:hypothetical protein n=1 Tax=Pseudovibrio sp. Ad13 TaxID=989396 RepID=UPI0007AE9098|nr:hypothetical protein [Pseudovibrio sp. Ad13]KZK83290.1 hypothetical protein PsAD13_02687 [Pseudovibrio sp. Ad13]
MSLTRSAKVVLAATAIAAIVGAQTASANRAVLVYQDLCNDKIPLTPTVLSWLTNPDYGQDYNSIYVLSNVGGIFPVTKNAPDFKMVKDLFVLGHGNCSNIFGLTSVKFALMMMDAFDGNVPDSIRLGSCLSGDLDSDNPASYLTLAFPKTSIKAFSTKTGILGNGSQFPKDWTFGQTAYWRTDAVVDRIDLLRDNIEAKWLAKKEGATKNTCTEYLSKAALDRKQFSFEGFADLILQEFSDADARMGNYDIVELFSYNNPPGLTACGAGLPFSSKDEPCATAHYTPPPPQ